MKQNHITLTPLASFIRRLPLFAAMITMAAGIGSTISPVSAQVPIDETAGAYWSFNSSIAVTAENLVGTPTLTTATDSTSTPVINNSNNFTANFTAFDGVSYPGGDNLRFTGSEFATTNSFTLQLNLTNGPGSFIEAEELRFNHRLSSTVTPLSDTPFTLEYNIGSGWVDTGKTGLDFGSTAGTWFAKTISLSDLTPIHGQENLQLRFTFPAYFAPGTSQNIRLDNIQFTGVAVIPEPSSIALLLTAGLCCLWLRRRKQA